jgi:hypothetical protein
MEHKKLIKIILNDITEIEELISEKPNGDFDRIEMELLSGRITSAKKMLGILYSDQFQPEKIPLENVHFQTHAISTPEPSEAEKKGIVPGPLSTPEQVIPIEPVATAGSGNEAFSELIPETEPLSVDILHFKPVNLPEQVVQPLPEVQTEPLQQTKSLEPPERHEIHEVHKHKPKQTLGDKFTKEKSVNDMVADQNKLEHKFSNLPIQNLQNAIGVNDRFLFIRELFDGDAAKFSGAVASLDKMNSLKEAVDYLQENFRWKKNDTSLKFISLVKRRFA